MTEKRFILKADYDWWGVLDTTGEIKGEYNDCFSTNEVVDLLNALHEENQQLKCDLKTLQLQDEDRKVYQRTLEAKIRRLKDRIKVFEKNYGSKDIQRIKDGELKGVLKGDYK